MLAALAMAFVPGAAGAVHECEADGTVPGTDPILISLGTQDDAWYQTFYIDDRGAFDVEGDGGGGLWIYAESNGMTGLQRGARQWVGDRLLEAYWPADSPVERPAIWTYDPCTEDDPGVPPDELLF